MPEFEKEEFTFPDEEKKVNALEIEADDSFEIEIEDDTPKKTATVSPCLKSL